MRARTAAQDSYIRALKRHELVFGVGPAGTGKTWLAVAHAAQLFERKEVDRIILSRPAVEAGERLGFLPGDLREKVDPYLRPIYDALYDLMDSRIVERALQAGEIEIAPLAFMRGRTLTNAVIILDEAQNTIVADILINALQSESLSVLATVIDVGENEIDAPAIGAHALLTEGGVETTGDWGNGFVLASAQTLKDEALAAGRRGLFSEFGNVQVAFEVVTPTVRLVICGSGPDAVPLVRFATQLGWDVIVVDHRPVVHAPVESFPGASVVECADSLRLGNSVELTSHTAAVVMSHHYARDLEYVRSLLGGGIAYIGILGPRARTERMFGETCRAKRWNRCLSREKQSSDRLALIFGGDGPDAIALSVIAEVSAVIAARRRAPPRSQCTAA